MIKIIIFINITIIALLADNFVLDNNSIEAKIKNSILGNKYTKRYTKQISLRLAYNGRNDTTYGTERNLEYNVYVRHRTLSVILDYRPYISGFRISSGLVLNNNQFDIISKPSDEIYTINGIKYTTLEVSTLTGNIYYHNFSPYIGIGYDNATKLKKSSFTADLGILYQGIPSASLDVRCGDILSDLGCLKLKENVLAEQLELTNELKKMKGIPLISVGMTYKF